MRHPIENNEFLRKACSGKMVEESEDVHSRNPTRKR